jgi:hypothetical protein
MNLKAVFTAAALIGGLSAVSANAQAEILHFNYVQTDGDYLSFDQDSNPIPDSFSTGVSTTEVVQNWSSNIGLYSVVIWYNESDGGLFSTADYVVSPFGSQVYSGSEAMPVFAPGVFSAYDFSSNLIGTLTITTGVPEPATWAMMILGLGFAGLGLRRRRGLATVA